MTHGSLFSGIGGFDLGAEEAGLTNVFQVEIDPFCNKVLAKNFPNVQRHYDIKSFTGKQYAGQIDIISGGFPCQPFTLAGLRKGAADDRALWPEMFRVIRTIRPTWVLAENVYGIIDLELDTVLSQMESIGYTTQAFVIPACAVGALHRRDRVWIFAYSAGIQLEKWRSRKTKKSEISRAEKNDFRNRAGRSFQPVPWQPNGTPDILRVAYGIPGELDGRLDRIKALGNAIQPQIAYHLFNFIKDANAKFLNELEQQIKQ